MWRTRDDDTVTCIACGDEVARSSAREYDKQGDRWTRADKEFEHLCKPCHGDLDHQPRGDLEAVLADIDTAGTTPERFLAEYLDRVERDRDRPDTRE